MSRGDTFGAIGGSGVFTDRPTITYTPLTGDKFLRGLISPIPVKSVLLMLQSGYPADFVLSWTVESLSGLRNRPTVPGLARAAQPEFDRALTLMRDIQIDGGVNLGIEGATAKDETTVVVFRAADLPESTREKSVELRRLLGLSTRQQRFRVVSSSGRGDDGQLALQPRSMFQVMLAVGLYVEVPPEHLTQHWAVPGARMDAATNAASPAAIHCSKEKPPDAYAAVEYKDYWFFVDQNDPRTKRVLAFLTLLFTLTDMGNTGNLPVLTIPTS